MEIGSTLVHIRNSIRKVWAHSSVWIEWLPAEQLVEGSNPSGPVLKIVHKYGFIYEISVEVRNSVRKSVIKFCICLAIRGY